MLAADDPDVIDIDLDIHGPVIEDGAAADWLMRADPSPLTSDPPPSPDMPLALEPPVFDTPPVLGRPPEIEKPAVLDEAPPLVGAPRMAVPEPAFPLFTAALGEHDDEPLIKLPVTPRPPLAVRRTPDTPRLRVSPRALRSIDPGPSLEFGEDARAVPEAAPAVWAGPRPVSGIWADEASRPRAAVAAGVGAPGARVAAAAIDHLLLGAIDVGVIYFTLRIAGLPMGDWIELSFPPLAFFLLLLKLAYFSSFTAVGGQTIGKMALHLRVVGDGDADVDAGAAFRRTLLGAVSTMALGLGFLPACFDADRRAFHDRVARTRVVAVRAA
ncbi:MAG: RDD family protein [Acidobacteria bacterium]|nr:RDD family protein [Acidobacteriota bacterium]